MNANELADLLKVDSWYKLVTREEITTMLRQQQVRIEQLLETQNYLYKRHDEQQADLKDADKYAFELERLYEDAKAEIEALKRALALKNNWEQISNEIQVKIVNDILRKDNEK